MSPLTRKLIVTGCFFFAILGSKAQKIDQSIAAYADKFSPERMYIHYDKPAYSAGETIWFKAYLMTEVLPAVDSKTLYIDWIDDKGNVLQHSVSPILDAATNGDYEVPVEYKGK